MNMVGLDMVHFHITQDALYTTEVSRSLLLHNTDILKCHSCLLFKIIHYEISTVFWNNPENRCPINRGTVFWGYL